jgi:RNA polymerase sigma-70 factor (ECF subfamily)
MSNSIAKTPFSIEILMEGCLRDDRKSQELLYRQFFGFAMAICLRYAHSNDEATQLVNDGFLKVFTKADQYDPTKPFKAWLRRVMVNTSLDYYRQNLKRYYHDEISEQHQLESDYRADHDLDYQTLLSFVQELSPAYRTVFNMYVIDGFSHEEIAKKLNISIGTSKGNLSRARENLRKMLGNYGR